MPMRPGRGDGGRAARRQILSMFNLAVHAHVPVELRSVYAYPTFYRGALDALAAIG